MATNTRWRRAGLAFLAALASVGATAQAPAATQTTIDVPRQPMFAALKAWSEQSGLQFLVNTDELTPGLMASAVKGQLAPEVALRDMLKGSGLEYEFVNAKTVRIAAAAAPAATKKPPASSTEKPENTESKQPSVAPASSETKEKAISNGRSTGQTFAPEEGAVEQVVVTGTRIQGELPVGSSLIVIDREAIDREGHATVQDIVHALPQNFQGGGANEGTRTGGGPVGVNSSSASSVNLRGLGPGSTLVLLNGRRLAPAGIDASFVDVSSLPASAIERIEVLLDGASAIYGADAVGGVVNIILKRTYGGAETRLQGGVPTQGAARDFALGQSLGGSWSTGSALIAYDFYQRDPLLMRDREVTANQDLRSQGGSDFRDTRGNPGTIVIGANTWAIPTDQDGSALTRGSFTAGTRNRFNTNETKDVLGDQERHSFFGSLTQSIGDQLELTADAIVSERDALTYSTGLTSRLSVPRTNGYYVNPTGGTGPILIDYNFVYDLGPLTTEIDVATYYGNVGADWRLPGKWSVSVQADLARESIDQIQWNRPIAAALNTALADSNRSTAFNPFGDGSFTNPATLDAIRGNVGFQSDSDLATATISATGPLTELPAGDLRVAAGLEFRDQEFATSTRSTPGVNTAVARESARDIRTAFLEFRAPLFGEANSRTGLQRLDLSLAGRYDRYSDFGSAASPALGLAWSPLADVTLQLSRSESYKAPTLPSLNESGNVTAISTIPDPLSPTGTSRVLFWTGNASADLEAEESEAWSVRVEWRPAKWSGVQLGLGYFDIDFQDRIQSVNRLALSFLQDPRFASSVTRNPSREQRAAVCARASFAGVQPNDCTDSPVAALIDIRPRNTATTRQRGIDFLAAQILDTAPGTLQVSLNASYLLRFDEAFTASESPVSIVSTQWQPVDFRTRGSIYWIRKAWSIGATAHYIDNYRDTVSNPGREIGSWTSVDVHLRYQTDHSVGGWLDDLSLSLHVKNALDREPRFFNNPDGIAYDPTNSDPSSILGRTIGLQIQKSWGRQSSP